MSKYSLPPDPSRRFPGPRLTCTTAARGREGRTFHSFRSCSIHGARLPGFCELNLGVEVDRVRPICYAWRLVSRTHESVAKTVTPEERHPVDVFSHRKLKHRRNPRLIWYARILLEMRPLSHPWNCKQAEEARNPVRCVSGMEAPKRERIFSAQVS